jgi:hypothetical protein
MPGPLIRVVITAVQQNLVGESNANAATALTATGRARLAAPCWWDK